MDVPFIIDNVFNVQQVKCPCGMTRRALQRAENDIATFHIVEISEDAREHYHKGICEIYFVLEGEGEMLLNGESHRVQPGSVVLINAGTRHKAVGKLKVIVVAIPPFNAGDEFFD